MHAHVLPMVPQFAEQLHYYHFVVDCYCDFHVDFDEHTPEVKPLTKSHLLKRIESSPTARQALLNWNRLNTTVRRLVHTTEV